MITKQTISQIEGEASLSFNLKNERVAFATIAFPHFRGIESLLKGKSALDALVITPRVCGICGHSHLMAAVRAIEEAYKQSGNTIHVTQKVQNLRELTLILEIIQNHFKWFYMTIETGLHTLNKNNTTKTKVLKGAYGASLATKILAVFAGQWPHSSYMIPGGITCDPTFVELAQAKSYLQQLQDYFAKETLGGPIEEFLSIEKCTDLVSFHGDIQEVVQKLVALEMTQKGFAGDEYIVMGEHTFTKSAKIKSTRNLTVQTKFVTTQQTYSPKIKSYAKNALYKNNFYEVGPLARCMSHQFKLMKNIHRRYKDSAYTRIIARLYEIAYLLKHAQTLLNSIDITEKSCVAIQNIDKITATGEGIVEAPRGTLIHRVTIKNGIIESYEIITPTQWNISSGTKEKSSPAQKAMFGLTVDEAEFVFRTFDVCSVCTTH